MTRVHSDAEGVSVPTAQTVKPGLVTSEQVDALRAGDRVLVWATLADTDAVEPRITLADEWLETSNLLAFQAAFMVGDRARYGDQKGVVRALVGEAAWVFWDDGSDSTHPVETLDRVPA